MKNNWGVVFLSNKLQPKEIYSCLDKRPETKLTFYSNSQKIFNDLKLYVESVTCKRYMQAL